MNIEETLEQVRQWKGCNKQYWQAVELLCANKRISEVTYNRLKKGLDCYTESIVNAEMLKYKTELQEKLAEEKQEKEEEPQQETAEEDFVMDFIEENNE